MFMTVLGREVRDLYFSVYLLFQGAQPGLR
jgi:hypothetical protein